MKFTVDTALYRGLLEKASEKGTYAIAEQLLADSDDFIKYDSGAMHDTGRPEQDGKNAAVVWDTPYALKQWYTGQGIKHQNTPGTPSTMWAQNAERKYRSDYIKILEKSLDEVLK